MKNWEGKYSNDDGTCEYEIYTGTIRWGTKKITSLLCKRTKSPVEGAVLNEPYPIEANDIEKLLRLGSWIKIKSK